MVFEPRPALFFALPSQQDKNSSPDLCSQKHRAPSHSSSKTEGDFPKTSRTLLFLILLSASYSEIKFWVNVTKK
jgi:hypothetical protein